MGVHIMFGDLSRSPDPRGYIARKLHDYFGTTRPSARDLAMLSNRAYSPRITADLPLASEEELPALSAGQTRHLTEEINLFREAVDRVSPLIDGEELLPGSDRCTLLKADFLGYPAGTPVLVRTTNLAAIHYLYGYAQVSASGRLTYLTDRPVPGAPASAEGTAPALLGASTGFDWAALLVKLAEGVAGGAGEKVGGLIASALLGVLFPGSGQQFDYKQMLDDFARIVREANQLQTISEQKADLEKVIRLNREDYLPKKAQFARIEAGLTGDELAKARTEHKATLYGKEYLHAYVNDLSKVISTLMTTYEKIDYTKPGLPACTLAMGVQLAIEQERALQDPDAQDDPMSSSDVDTIRTSAPEYADHVERVAHAIFSDKLTERLNKISEVRNNPFCDPGVCKSRYYFFDDETGYHSGYYEQVGCHDDPERRCADARTNYYNGIEAQTRKTLQQSLDWAFSVVEPWRRLAKDPLGAPVGKLAATGPTEDGSR
jgi:hypothetical protein